MSVNVKLITFDDLWFAPKFTQTWWYSVEGLIQPDGWYWMSAVPSFHDVVHPDRPLQEMSIQALAQWGERTHGERPTLSKLLWNTTWYNPGTNGVWFRPTLMIAIDR